MGMSFGAAIACEEPRALQRPADAGAGKRALFGDPALVPTRAGERAREELALADAIAAALRALGGEALAVEVRLPRSGDPGAVVVTGQAPPGFGEDEAERLVRELCGPWSAAVTRVAWLRAAASAPPERGHMWPLVGALIGLGASAGVTFDRLRRRRRRSRVVRV